MVVDLYGTGRKVKDLSGEYGVSDKGICTSILHFVEDKKIKG